MSGIYTKRPLLTIMQNLFHKSLKKRTKLRIIHNAIDKLRASAVEVYRNHLARVAARSPTKLNTLLRKSEVGIGANKG